MTLSSRRTLLFVLICVLGGSLAVATGATVISTDADTLANDRVAIQPAPDTPYASLDEDGELVVDLTAASFENAEGLNVNAVTTFDDLFTIAYTADEFAEVWLETDSDLLTFTANGESIEGKSNNVTLGPNEAVSIGIAVDTREVNVVPGDVREEDFDVHARVKNPEESSVETDGDGDDGSNDGTSTSIRGDGTERTLTAENVDSGETVSFDPDGVPLDGANVTLDRLDLTAAGGGSYELGISGTPDPVAGVGVLETDGVVEAHAYLVLEYEFDADDVDELTLAFSADSEYLDDNGVNATDLAVFRTTDDGDWEELEVDLVDESDADQRGLAEDRTHFETTTEDLSVFAVASHGGSGTTDGDAAGDADESSESDVEAVADGNDGGPSDNDGSSAEGGAAEEPDEDGAAAVSEDGRTGPVEEPAAFGVSELGGLFLLLLVVLIVIALVRRAPRAGR